MLLPLPQVIPPKGWSPRKGKVDLDKVGPTCSLSCCSLLLSCAAAGAALMLMHEVAADFAVPGSCRLPSCCGCSRCHCQCAAVATAMLLSLLLMLLLLQLLLCQRLRVPGCCLAADACCPLCC